MESNPQVDAITKALAYTENGGKPDIKSPKAGKTGEMASIFQLEPDTWKNYSTQVLGQVVPLTPDVETYVVQKKIGQWLQQGYLPKQIASMWNAGVGEPDSYSGKFSDGTSSIGVNKKYGVKYDVPSYVDKFTGYLDEFLKSPSQSSQAEQGPQLADAEQKQVLPSVQAPSISSPLYKRTPLNAAKPLSTSIQSS